MQPILVYGYPAGSSMGLVAALEWWGKPYKLSRVDMLGEMREPPYKSLNGRVETPVLITLEGNVVTETMAIAAWIEARDTDRKVSFDPDSPEADRMHQLMGFVNSSFVASFGPLWAAMEMSLPNPELQKQLKLFGTEAVIHRHNQLEEMMGNGPYLVGDKPTLADALLIGIARWLDFHQVKDRSYWPKLNKWREKLEADPAVLFATALEEGKDLKGSGTLVEQLAISEVIKKYGKS